MKTIFSLRVLLIILLFLLLHTFSENSQAQKNYNVTIETQEIEQQIYRPSTQEVSYENANVIKGENYEAVLGFEDSRADIFFSISSSGSIIDYGKLYPTNPITRDSRLSIDSLGSNGYAVFAYQDHPMTGISANNIIPNTSCDRGLCSKTTPALWNDSLTYGLGYSCEDIINSPCNNFGKDLFKKFADEASSDSYEAVLYSDKASNDEAKIIYKLNISSSQPTDTYSNKTYFIALPAL